MADTSGKTKRVTVANVAQKAGVSTTTVSLILSEREDYLRQFHPDTIKRVRATARRMGYHSNLFASGLPTKASSFFALIVREESTEEISSWHQWSFEGDLLAGIIKAAGSARVYPIVATAESKLNRDTIRPLERVIAGGVFGAIVRTPHSLLERYLQSRLKQGQPIVVIFPQHLGRWRTNAIDVDNVAIGQMAGEMLAAQGRRNWAAVTYKQAREPHALRIQGFRKIAEEKGVPVEVLQLPLGVTDLEARDYLAPRLHRLRCDGIFSLDSVSSVGMLLACMHIGLRPLEDFHQVGCDCSMWQSPPLPRITSVDISWKDVGVRALHQLNEAYQSGNPIFDSVLLAPRVIAAETCPALPLNPAVALSGPSVSLA